MRLALLLLPLLGRGLGGGDALYAQNGVTVSGLVVDAGTVTFEVGWEKPAPETVWSDTVWVWVDYNNAGMMERLPLETGGATLTETSAPGVGSVIEVSGNDKGVWVVGNARSAGSFSATVKLLTAPAEVAGACVYASNYPPMGKYLSATEIAFTGTPPYEVVLNGGDGTTTQTVESSPYMIPDTYAVQSFTDKTGAPGIIKCSSVATPEITASASTVCQDESLVFTVPYTENTTYTWTASAGTSSSNSYTFDTSTDGAVTATVYSEVTLGDVTCRSANAATVTAAVNAPATITTHPVSQTFCEATISPTLTVTVTAGDGETLTYQWKEGVGTDVGTNADSYTPTVTATTEYWVVVTVNNSCSVTSNKVVITVSFPVAGEIGVTACDIRGEIGVTACDIGGEVGVTACDIEGEIGVTACDIEGEIGVTACDIGGEIGVTACDIGGEIGR